MTAEEAVRYLEDTYSAEPTYDHDTEDAYLAIQRALTLAYKALSVVEWETWDLGDAYCIWCGNGRHVGHDSKCRRQLALASIKEKKNEQD